MRLPRSWKDITVEEYQTIYPILYAESETDWDFIISFFTGKTLEQVQALDRKFWLYIYMTLLFLKKPIKEQVSCSYFKTGFLKAIHYNPKPKKLLRLNGKIFKASSGVDEINAYRLTTIKTLLKEKQLHEVLPDLCALTYEENTKKWFGFKFEYFRYNHDKNAFLFKDAPMSVAYPVVFFCLEVLRNWTLNTPDYLESQMIVEDRMKEIEEMILSTDIESIGLGNLQSMN